MSINEAQMTAYTALPDESLSDLARRGDRDAEEILVKRYNRLVRQLARPFYLAGGDSDDLIQEGMIGLICAVREYDGQRAASFRTFAEICIRNRLYSAVRAAARDKHTPLNQSVPLEMPFFDGQSSCFGAMAGENPEDLIIGRERVQDALSDVRKQLSDFEAKILGYYLDGLTIREMAKAVLRSPKSVDNAVQRIRRKAARHLQAGDLSKG
ncbi:MAG: sigma-70 family RNA polymerase sigma factor [Oscillospiraceae bacterium]|jgi:RNA polymerase sporulation-specific sigma factor|nr:sigma-70 family RNA polymerase sigma factor [Oscillospiraceae bacterium]MDE7042277.1 sigma-70 family RNA polymerase sigma factor [Oscillospiraceae bacterium]